MKAVLLALSLLFATPAAARDLTIFAAASLTDALKDLAAQWVTSGQKPPRISFASSSTLARQIEQGAEANLFASADTPWMDYLAQRGLIAADTRADLIGNTLVLIAPIAQPRQVTLGPGVDLRAILGPNGRIAVGDPAHVPVGLYAAQALRAFGVWEALEPRLARTADVRAALLFVERGEAPLGIVYATDAAVSRKVMVAGEFPAGSHAPIVYPFAVTKAGDTPLARRFLAALSAPAAHATFLRHGFRPL